MGKMIHWTCEACDSPNSVEEGEPLNCRFCRLTYEVRIAPDIETDRTDKLPVDTLLEDLQRPEPDEPSEESPADLPEAEPEE